MHGISRRSLLRAGVLGVAVAPFGSARLASAAAAPTNLFTRSRFVPHLNASFKMVSSTSTWTATLVSISDLAAAPPGDEARFRLTFRTAVRGPTDGIYSFRRGGFTSTSMFVAADSAGRSYEAIINRPT